MAEILNSNSVHAMLTKLTFSCISRAKRQLPYGGAFDGELNCDPDSCTMIRCTIGALDPNQGVIFRVRSRLFTQTLVEVKISLN